MSGPLQDSIQNNPRGAQVIQSNQLSTPVIAIFMVGFMLLGLGVGYAIARSNSAVEHADLKGQSSMERSELAERNAAVSRNHTDNLEVRVSTLERALKVSAENHN